MSANEMLARMREEKKKNEADEVKADPENFYVKLRIVTHRRRQLALYLSIAFFAILSLVMQDIRSDRSWTLIALPITFIGLIIAMIPPSEEWVYKPWQARPRQYERHQIERR